MTKNAKQKREIRARGERTGEKYVTARRHVLGPVGEAQDVPLPPQVPAPVSAPNLRDQIRAVLDAHPDLTAFGFRPVGGTGSGGLSRLNSLDQFQTERDSLLTPDGVQQVEKCLRYLALVRKTRSAKPKEGRILFGSYGFKRHVESWLEASGRKGDDTYVSNGALITAALIAGVPTYQDDPRSPNCDIGVIYEDVRAVQEGKDPREWRKTTAFVKWLFAQAGRNDPVGDLAGDCKRDFNFPRQGNVAALRAYLLWRGDHIKTAFEEARLEYRAGAATRRSTSP